MKINSRVRWIFLLILIPCSQSMAASASFWDDLLRGGTKTDEVVGISGRGGKVAGELASEKGLGRSLTKELDEITDAAARSKRAKLLIKDSIYGPGEDTLKQLDTLSPHELEAALVLARGGKHLVEAVPDVAARSRLLKQGGPDLVAATGRHGPEMAREATRLEALTLAGKLPTEVGSQATLARFGELMRSGGNGCWEFWKKNVVPNWKKWAVGTAIVTYLIEPEIYHDALGNLTAEGTRRLNEVIGIVVSSTMEGAAEGGKNAMQRVLSTFSKHFFDGFASIGAWLGLAVVVWVIGILLPRTREWFLSPLLWLFRKSKT